jgi:hypothetical protein
MHLSECEVSILFSIGGGWKLRQHRIPADKREHPTTTVIAAPIASQPALESVGVEEATETKGATISVATLHQFDTAESYQLMLSSMISRLQRNTLSDHQVDQDGFTASSNSSDKFSWESSSNGSEGQWQLQKFRGRKSSVSPHDMAISSVDPLHFLGITPTNQNAGLLHACKTDT